MTKPSISCDHCPEQIPLDTGIRVGDATFFRCSNCKMETVVPLTSRTR
jgi:hypothetical protein